MFYKFNNKEEVAKTITEGRIQVHSFSAVPPAWTISPCVGKTGVQFGRGWYLDKEQRARAW